MIDSVLNLVFRCSHRRLTRPVTPVARHGEKHQGTYVVCLDCGKQFAYDPREMRLGKAIRVGESPTPNQPPAPKPEAKPVRKFLFWAFVPLGVLVGTLLRNGRDRSAR